MNFKPSAISYQQLAGVKDEFSNSEAER